MKPVVNNPLALMLSRFLESESQLSLLIHGPWGIGKTYALEEFLNTFDFGASGRFVARSNVSLFGRPSLVDIQAAIFSVAKQVSTDQLAREKLGQAASGYFSLRRFIDGPEEKKGFNLIVRKAGQIQLPWVGRLGELWSHGNYELVDGFLVVLDDLERHSSSVSFKDVLGLVSDLVSQRRSKVIAVCNEDVLSDDERTLLNSFREKIFDVEIRFQRSPRDVAEIGVPKGAAYAEAAISIFEKLAVSNVRVVKKFSYFVDQFWREIEGEDERLVREILEHAALLTWARYDATAGVPADMFPSLASGKHWFSAAMRDEEVKKADWEVAWEAAASALQFSSEAYDPALVDYLKTGIWIAGSLGEHLDAKKRDINRLAAQTALRSAWKMYGDSLAPDKQPIVANFLAVVREHAQHLAPRDVDAVFSLLEDVDVDVSPVRDSYLAVAGDEISVAANEDWPFEDFKSEALRPAVIAARDLGLRIPSIDAALAKISIDRSWSEEDVVALTSCSDADLIDWIESSPENLVAKIRNGLLAFRSMQSDDVRYRQIGEKAERVLRHFASLSDLNRVRVKNMFNVEPVEG